MYYQVCQQSIDRVGPGAYDTNRSSSFNKSGGFVGNQKKFHEPKNYTPGPTEYSPDQYASKPKGHAATIGRAEFNRSVRGEFEPRGELGYQNRSNNRENNVGPGSYQVRDNMTRSKSPSVTITRAPRSPMESKIGPGVGHYYP